METQERIIQKAQELFLKYGIRSVTMDEIASQLGMSKKTLYQFVADKDELVDVVAKNHIGVNQTRCVADRAIADNAIHQIFLTMDMMEEMMANMNPAVFNDLQKYHPKTYTRFNEHRNSFLYDFIKGNLIKGIEEALYREDVNIEIMTKIRLETMFLPFNSDVFPPMKYNLADIERELLEHYLYGISTLKGLKLIEKYKQQRLKKLVK